VDKGNALKLKLNILEPELPTLLACDRVISVISTDHKKMNSRWWQFGEAARSDHPSHDDPQMTTLLLFPVSFFNLSQIWAGFVQCSSTSSGPFDDCRKGILLYFRMDDATRKII
jgi:hypothetical protein